MLRVNNIVRGRQSLTQIREELSQQSGIRAHYRQFHLGTLIQEFTNYGYATGRMPKPPIQRCYKDFQREASSQALAQSPWS